MVEVRDLTVDDVARVAKIFSKATRETQKQITASAENLSVMTLVMALLETEDAMMEWTSDLIGVTLDEFKAMPATTILDVIDQLGAKPETRDFFSRACRMAGGAWKRLSTLFSIDTAGLTKKSGGSPTQGSDSSAA